MTVTRVKRLVNPYRPKRVAKRRAARPRKNPASIITLGLINPHRPAVRTAKAKTKGQTKMTAAKKKAFVARMAKARASKNRKKNPTKRHHTVTHHRKAVRRNGTRIYVMKRNARRRNGYRRNPEMFGMRGANAGKAILAGLVGVYATKTITPMVSNAIPQVGGSPIFSAIISAAVAWGGGMILGKWDKTAAEGFMFGGLMQAGSQLLNLVVPSNPLSLSGLGDWVPGSFPVPQNPISGWNAPRGRIGSPSVAQPAPAAGMGAAVMFQ